MGLGLIWAQITKRTKSSSGCTEMIIQITTVGNHSVVNWIVEELRNYQLPFKHQIWIVVEPWVEPGFEGMDELIVVPEDFTSMAHFKARAQDYSRTVRRERGLGRRDLKIVMLDDDSLPTRKYFIDALNADYDICEGVTTPRLHYGRFLSHLDDLRTLTCLVICSNFQGHGHPIFVHGEGLCIRGSAEQDITWNYPVVASEDLTFGQNAVERGMSWGWIHEYIQLTSPWTWSDFIKQRRRWTWGNIDAVRRGLIPPSGGLMLVARLFLGNAVGLVSFVGLLLVPLGVIHVSDTYFTILLVALSFWLIECTYAVSVGASYEKNSRSFKIKQTIIGVLLAPITSMTSIVVFFTVLFKGNPKKFEVIAKAKPEKRGAKVKS